MYNWGMKEVIKVITWFLILLSVVVFAIFIYGVIKIRQPITTDSRPQTFEVAKGQTSKQISKSLSSQNIIGHDLLFRIYIWSKGAEGKLQAGTYTLDSNMNIPEIVRVLSLGQVKSSGVRVTVVEGWSAKDIGKRFENLSLITSEQFLDAVQNKNNFVEEFDFLNNTPVSASLEGFLFPDTYVFKDSANSDEIIRIILKNFGNKITPEIMEQIKKQNRNLYEVLILASIVEREVGRNLKQGSILTDQDRVVLAQERRIVSSVFLNRLRIGMALESDATLNYVIDMGRSRATFEDLKIDSPYNTYKNKGLPPTPISNPSLDAILSVVNPAQTDYLFFLTSPDGKAYFAKTLSEHIQNREKYLR